LVDNSSDLLYNRHILRSEDDYSRHTQNTYFIHSARPNPCGNGRRLARPGPEFTSCKFIGITNGGQFCYTAVFQVKGGTDSTKVFLDYNHTMDRVFTDYQLTDWA